MRKIYEKQVIDYKTGEVVSETFVDEEVYSTSSDDKPPVDKNGLLF